jgi:hypothetical protein
MPFFNNVSSDIKRSVATLSGKTAKTALQAITTQVLLSSDIKRPSKLVSSDTNSIIAKVIALPPVASQVTLVVRLRTKKGATS